MIRPLTPADAEEITALYVANRRFLAPFEPERTEEFFTVDFQRQRIEVAGDDLWRWGIVDGGELAGMITLADVIRGALQLGNVGYWVDRSHNGRGLASTAVGNVIEFAFGEGGLHRLEAGTLVDNHVSQRVLEKNGFERFGLARKLLKINGEWRDHVLFERIAD
ncbi:MAG TPA: GNAT family protein [Gaiellaceae bacterium]